MKYVIHYIFPIGSLTILDVRIHVCLFIYVRVHGENTRKLLSNVANTFAKHSACSASCPAPSGPICTPTNSLKLDATSCTFSTMFRVCRGDEVWRVISCVSSVIRRIAVRHDVRCSGNVDKVMSDIATTKNFEAVTNTNVCSVSSFRARWNLSSSILVPPPASCAAEHCAAT